MRKTLTSFVGSIYKKDFNQEQLEMQLDVIASNLPDEQFAHDPVYLRELSDPQRGLHSEVCTLAQVLYVIPATNAVMNYRSAHFEILPAINNDTDKTEQCYDPSHSQGTY